MADKLLIGFPCPGCGSRETSCLSSRGTVSGVTRRRRCRTCDHRFTTHEDIKREPDHVAATRFIAAAVHALAGGGSNAPR